VQFFTYLYNVGFFLKEIASVIKSTKKNFLLSTFFLVMPFLVSLIMLLDADFVARANKERLCLNV